METNKIKIPHSKFGNSMYKKIDFLNLNIYKLMRIFTCQEFIICLFIGKMRNLI